VLGQQHLVGEDAAGFTQPGSIERLKSFIDEMSDIGASARAVIPDGLS
jgi:hypothetical protein